MSETYEEIASAHEWRDPAIAWPFFLVSYLVAIVLYFVLAVAAATVWASYTGLITISADDATRFDSIVVPLNTALVVVFLTCAVSTSFLTYRTFANAHAAGAQNRLTGPLLAAGAYYMPFIGFFLPPLMMGKLWQATFGDDGPNPGGIIAMWWGTFLLGCFFATISMNAVAETFEHEVRWVMVSTISLVLRGVAATCLLITFGAIVKRQHQNRAPS
jgi:hypothetical protein